MSDAVVDVWYLDSFLPSLSDLSSSLLLLPFPSLCVCVVSFSFCCENPTTLFYMPCLQQKRQQQQQQQQRQTTLLLQLNQLYPPMSATIQTTN